MQENPIRMAQRAIVTQVLRDDHDERWTLAELEREATGLPSRAVGDGLARLEAEGVVVSGGGCILASRCTRHIDALDLIGV